jgi:hypothetical protein
MRGWRVRFPSAANYFATTFSASAGPARQPMGPAGQFCPWDPLVRSDRTDVWDPLVRSDRTDAWDPRVRSDRTNAWDPRVRSDRTDVWDPRVRSDRTRVSGQTDAWDLRVRFDRHVGPACQDGLTGGTHM